MNIEDLTIAQAREIARQFASPEIIHGAHPWIIGTNYLIRTVTMIDTGRLVSVSSQELVLEDAAWIADTGRFSNAIKSAEFAEVEPFPDGKVIIGRGSIIDAVSIKELPRKQK